MTGDESFAARGVSNPLGKLTAEVKIWLPEPLKDELTMLACLRRKTLSEYLREVLMVHAYGAAEYSRLQATSNTGRDVLGTET